MSQEIKMTTIPPLTYFCSKCNTYHIPSLSCLPKKKSQRVNWKILSQDANCVYVFERSLWICDFIHRRTYHVSLDKKGKPQCCKGNFLVPEQFLGLGFEMWNDSFLYFDNCCNDKNLYFTSYYRTAPTSVLISFFPKDLSALIIQYLGDSRVGKKCGNGENYYWMFLRFENWVVGVPAACSIEPKLLKVQNLLDHDNNDEKNSFVFPAVVPQRVVHRVLEPEQMVYKESLVERWLLQCERRMILVHHLGYIEKERSQMEWTMFQTTTVDPFLQGFMSSQILALRCLKHYIWLLSYTDETKDIHLNIYRLDVYKCAFIPVQQNFVMKAEFYSGLTAKFDVYEQEPNVYRIFFILRGEKEKRGHSMPYNKMFWVRLPTHQVIQQILK